MIRIFFFLSLALCLGGCGKSCSGSGKTSMTRKTDQERLSTKETESRERMAQPAETPDRYRGGPIVVQMKRKGGVTTIPVEINGTTFDFIFDTGASSICISTLEAAVLYKNGNISEEDILGSESYQTADGTIGVGTTINLKTVKIGNLTLTDVEATVIDNPAAPLLLGQSALQRFGEFSVDYKRNRITFH